MENFITLKIPGVTESDVLYGIVVLAGFPKGYVVKKVSPGCWPKINSHSLWAWHKDSTDSNLEFMAEKCPDIAVSQVYEKKPGQPSFEPTDKYRIAITEKVNPEIFGRLEERIREEYKKTSFPKRFLGNLFRFFQKSL